MEGLGLHPHLLPGRRNGARQELHFYWICYTTFLKFALSLFFIKFFSCTFRRERKKYHYKRKSFCLLVDQYLPKKQDGRLLQQDKGGGDVAGGVWRVGVQVGGGYGDGGDGGVCGFAHVVVMVVLLVLMVMVMVVLHML